MQDFATYLLIGFFLRILRAVNKLALGEAFGKKPKPCAVIGQNFERGLGFVVKHKKVAVKRLKVKAIFNGSG
jgi:hypothetical protein